MGSRDYSRPQAKTYLKTDNRDRKYIDYKSADELRRLMTPNGKIYSRKRLGTSAKEQQSGNGIDSEDERPPASVQDYSIQEGDF